ncbi:hypothetical protein [Deinococcus ruber]|uniref:hypothetical protein n=1 Tax=Deinococcus ruber TaxID=1848197 RepID=UPI001E4F9077|nr:hypothetical protein [Deinococcus ruber]
MCSAHAQSTGSVVQALINARTEIIAVLPKVGCQDIAVALKTAAAKGTSVFLITERATVHRGGYLLNVSHGPESIQTYLYAGPLPSAWVLVDNAWVASGVTLDQEGVDVAPTISQDAATLRSLNTWARQVTAAGPIKRPDLLKLHYGK